MGIPVPVARILLQEPAQVQLLVLEEALETLAPRLHPLIPKDQLMLLHRKVRHNMKTQTGQNGVLELACKFLDMAPLLQP